MGEKTHEKISMHQLTYYWVDPGGSQHEAHQRTNLYGYFPTPEEARTHATEMNLGKELLDDDIRPSSRHFGNDNPRRPAPSFPMGFHIKRVVGFTPDDGKTFELLSESSDSTYSSMKVEDGHRSMYYRDHAKWAAAQSYD
ncbi:MAG: hypothetical protein JWN89_118 [Parcubacteria group bacterium]|nr:hypothetical protein [Parcubacteria group bacterium]